MTAQLFYKRRRLVAQVGGEETGQHRVGLSGGLGAWGRQESRALGVLLIVGVAHNVGKVGGGHLDQDLAELNSLSTTLLGDGLAGATLVPGVHAASGGDTVVEGHDGDLLKTSLDVGKAKLLLGKGLAQAGSVLQVVGPDIGALGTELLEEFLGSLRDETDELPLQRSGAASGEVLEALLRLLEETALLVDFGVGGGHTRWVLVEEQEGGGAEIQFPKVASLAVHLVGGGSDNRGEKGEGPHVDLDVAHWYAQVHRRFGRRLWKWIQVV